MFCILITSTYTLASTSICPNISRFPILENPSGFYLLLPLPLHSPSHLSNLNTEVQLHVFEVRPLWQLVSILGVDLELMQFLLFQLRLVPSSELSPPPFGSLYTQLD